MQYRTLLLVAFVLLAAELARSAPAHHGLVKYVQKLTGETVLVRLVGDQWGHRHETEDGYTVVQKDGTWYYALTDVVVSEKAPKPAHQHKPVFTHERDSDLVRRTPIHIEAPEQTGNGVFSTTTRRLTPIPILVICIEFSDSHFLNTPVSTVWYDNFFNLQTQGSVNSFYNYNSNGRFTFTEAQETDGTVNDGITYVSLTTTHPNDGVTAMRAALVSGIDAIASKVSWSQYDLNHDGYLDSRGELVVFVIFPGTERAVQCSSYDCPYTWAAQYTWNTPIPIPGTSLALNNNIFISELVGCDCTQLHTMGTHMHELGHAVGLPDQYDTTGTVSWMREWSLMNGGNWCGTLGDQACCLDAWSRAYLGWVDVNVVGTTASQAGTVSVMGSATTVGSQVYQMRKQSGGRPWIFSEQTGRGEFFLLEYRSTTNDFFDGAAPGTGLLLWHVDYSNKDYTNQINVNTPYMVTVVPASGTPADSDYGSATDCWTSGSFDCSSTVDSNLNDNARSCVGFAVTSTTTVTFNSNSACNGQCCGDDEQNVGEQCDGTSHCQGDCTCEATYPNCGTGIPGGVGATLVPFAALLLAAVALVFA